MIQILLPSIKSAIYEDYDFLVLIYRMERINYSWVTSRIYSKNYSNRFQIQMNLVTLFYYDY
jgi:hypothetical protein